MDENVCTPAFCIQCGEERCVCCEDCGSSLGCECAEIRLADEEAERDMQRIEYYRGIGPL
jgi:hypothetical protein